MGGVKELAGTVQRTRVIVRSLHIESHHTGSAATPPFRFSRFIRLESGTSPKMEDQSALAFVENNSQGLK